ncbi:dienelactone hydrolase [Arthrobacter jiangjiafuii]|uniref:Dienelactone hydrolase n=1 Tax=Arthrobacter jiangjiafuii TaxID=2817475 RepID=A0A975M506_9MICC|nr:alpha/beta family hydrolase [Arthrobacter jiangjiafuii]MBP3042347.1 dienelactone hydrolase [Arthrobacter jiangjiafuii]QWC09899.1 dienelactone hydrolase [Arthrobacter jiangjiafuii]
MPLEHEQFTLPTGDTEVTAAFAGPADATAAVVVAHGAGAGMDHPFLTGFTDALNDGGVATLRFNFPYREAGRKFPDRPPAAIAAWRAAMEAAAARTAGLPLWACGKSFGGRMASMAVAEGMTAAGLIFLGYPLHPPGKPEKLRDEHLYGLSLPMLFLQGTRDPFALPGELEPVAERIGPNAVVQWIDGGNHSFEVRGNKRAPEVVGADMAKPVLEFTMT